MNPSDDQACAALRKLISDSADKLIEHCSCVVVMVVFDYENGENDQSFFSYRGGSHTAMGLASEFIHVRLAGRHAADESDVL